MTALLTLPRPGATVTATDYERMRDAIAVVVTVDEAKAWTDKAAAAAHYARQIRDPEIETWLTEVRRRAEVRLGELLLTIEPSKGGARTHSSASTVAPSIRRSAIAAGIDPATATRLMRLAGPRDPDLQAVGTAARETLYAQARATQSPVTRVALQKHIDAAIDAALGPDNIRRRAKALRHADQAAKAEKRAAREVSLGERTRAAAAALGRRIYAVGYVDVPWKTEVWSEETGLDRAPENHYPTLSLEEICTLDVPFGDDAALFFWVPASRVHQALVVLAAWRFAYKTQLVWRKPYIGTGYWVRDQHELLFIAVRGDVPAPVPGTQPTSVIDAPRGRHSEKPAIFAEIIERMFPTAPKVELFARASRPGWDVWGNEAEAAA